MKKGENSTATIVPATLGAGPESAEEPTLSLVTPAPHQEEVDGKLEAAREQLVALRRQQEELERAKSELEELRRKQDEYARGKAEMIDHLTRSLITLEREQIQSQRVAELCDKTGAAFRDYLEQLQSINDEEWSSANVRAELSAALGVIENSRLEYNRARTKLDCLNPAAGQPLEPVAAPKAAEIDWNEMLRWLRLGAAASAPLIAAGTIWLIILLVAGR
jgi:DNA repair exonuclease SbcCD ATPase subunit